MVNGAKVFDLQQLLGHSDIKMTMKYAHHSPDHPQDSIKFMGINNVAKSENVLTLF